LQRAASVGGFPVWIPMLSSVAVSVAVRVQGSPAVVTRIRIRRSTRDNRKGMNAPELTVGAKSAIVLFG